MITMMKIVRRLKTHLSTSSEFATCGKVARQADWALLTNASHSLVRRGEVLIMEVRTHYMCR